MRNTILALLLLPTLLLVGAIAAADPIPVIYDTDIGGDIDDTWALAFLLKCPELDLQMIVTDSSNATYRAKVAAKMLEAAGRTDIPIGIGLHIGENTNDGQAPWVKDYDLAQYPGTLHQDGVGAMIKHIMNAEEPITLICVGPVPNIAKALQREPRIAQKAKFVGMHGSVRKGYGGAPTPAKEANVRHYTQECQQALSAPWDITITPLDTCGLVALDGENYAKIRNAQSPLLKALLENYAIWRKNTGWFKDSPEYDHKSSTLFDTVAVYLAFTRKHLTMEQLPIRVTDDGYTIIDPAAKKMDVATEWKDLDAFEDLLTERLLNP